MGGTAELLSLRSARRRGWASLPCTKPPGKGRGRPPLAEARLRSPSRHASESKDGVPPTRACKRSHVGRRAATIHQCVCTCFPGLCLLQLGLLNSALAWSRGAPHPPGSWPLSTWETGAGGAGAPLRPCTERTQPQTRPAPGLLPVCGVGRRPSLTAPGVTKEKWRSAPRAPVCALSLGPKHLHLQEPDS